MSVLVDWNEFALLLASKLENQTDETKIISIFKKLRAIPMTLEILKETKIGKIVNGFRKYNNPYICEDAKSLVQDWKKIANESVNITNGKTHEYIPLKINSSCSDNQKNCKELPSNTSSFTSNVSKSKKEIHKASVNNFSNNYRETTSLSNIFGAEKSLLNSNDARKKCINNNKDEKYKNSGILPMEELLKSTDCDKSNSVKNVNLSSKFPNSNNYGDIIPDYIPNLKTLFNTPQYIPSKMNSTFNNILVEDNSILKNSHQKTLNEDQYFQKSKTRTQVYSGRKNILPIGFQKVPTLYSLCIKVLTDNIDIIECIGGVPGELIAPVLEKCNPSQLFNLEHYNPKLLEDTDGYWERHCAREFRQAHNAHTKLRLEDPGAFMQTWRDVYLEELDSREHKLKQVTANISASHHKVDQGPRVKLAFMSGTAKPPRNVIRQQAKFNQHTGLPSKYGKYGTSKNQPAPAIINGVPKSSDISHSVPSNSSYSNTMTGTLRPNTTQIDPETYSLPKALPPVKRSAPMMDKTLKFFKRFKMRR